MAHVLFLLDRAALVLTGWLGAAFWTWSTEQTVTPLRAGHGALLATTPCLFTCPSPSLHQDSAQTGALFVSFQRELGILSFHLTRSAVISRCRIVWGSTVLRLRDSDPPQILPN